MAKPSGFMDYERVENGSFEPLVRIENFKEFHPVMDDEKRREVITKMAERGIPCNVHYKPLPMMTAYKAMGFSIAAFPNAYAHYANEVSLPLHTKLSDDDVDYICENYKAVLKECGLL